MENLDINKKVTNSIKWSGLTEIASKLVTPVTSMILARLLTPEEFGVIATVNMVTSFADIFTDAGFQKYLIQKQFNTNEELDKSANVAFWTNISISAILWLLISLFSDQIASLVGNPGLGKVIIIASSALLLTSFSSIQTAIYRKKFDFKTLFYVRIISVFVPVFVTIPLALYGYSYWSIVIGTLVTQAISAIILTVRSTWKPSLFYNTHILKIMFAFSMWVLMDSILQWLTSNCDVFIVGKFLNSYYLGLYRNSISMVNGIFNVIVFSTTAVLLSALSAVKNNNKIYNHLFFSFQKTVSLILFPLGAGIFIYRDLATSILLGSQWTEASFLIGLWSLANAFSILTGQYISIIFTSKGVPKLSVFSQVLQLIELIPLLLIGLNFGFQYLIITRCLARLLYGVINLVIAKIYISMSIKEILKNLFPAFLSTIGMSIAALLLLQFSSTILWQIITIIIDIIVFFLLTLLFPSTRTIVIGFTQKIYSKIINKIKK